MSILEPAQIKFLNRMFYDEYAMRVAILEEQALQVSNQGRSRTSGHSFTSDPTATTAIKNLTPISKVKVRGSVYDHPETWLLVMQETWAYYGASMEKEAMFRRYHNLESPETTCIWMGIGRTTYFAWREDFLTQAAFFATKRNIF
ncbi:MAG: hypothetical protein RR910_08100 [Acidaminococcaceae bacterium]